MYTLYYSPGACSLAIHALLYELSVPFETVRVDINAGQQRTPEFLKLNPRGQVPVLVDDGHILRESGAMALYLLGRHESVLWPRESAQAANAAEWLFFYNSTLQQAYNAYFLMSKLTQEEARHSACQLVSKRIAYLWREVETHLGDNEYVCGSAVTIVDFFHAVIANWTTALAHKVELGVNIRRLCGQVAVMDAFKRALEAEKIPYALTKG